MTALAGFVEVESLDKRPYGVVERIVHVDDGSAHGLTLAAHPVARTGAPGGGTGQASWL